MSFHDNVAYKAASMGKTATQFNAAAQEHANATWFFLIIAGVVWYFTSWGWALIPAAVAAFTAFQSVSSTMIATRLEQLGEKFK